MPWLKHFAYNAAYFYHLTGDDKQRFAILRSALWANPYRVDYNEEDAPIYPLYVTMMNDGEINIVKDQPLSSLITITHKGRLELIKYLLDARRIAINDETKHLIRLEALGTELFVLEYGGEDDE